jgi:hypothetical protein
MTQHRRTASVLFVLALAAGFGATRARADDFRVVAAQQEMATLADAEESAAIDTSFYVALEALNDGVASNPGSVDWINDGGGSFVIPPAKGGFNAARKLFGTQFGQPNYWGGPYVAFQQGKTQAGAAPYDKGSPLDPWGQPYLFFSPLGLLRGDTGTVAYESYADAFDRYTIVSYGPDGIKSGDDLAYQFGGGVSVFALSGIKGSGVGTSHLRLKSGTGASAGPAPAVFTAPAGGSITVRGLNLGATAAGASVFFNAVDITGSIADWRVVGTSPQQRVEIDIDLPPSLYLQGALHVERHDSSGNIISISNALELLLPAAPVNAASDWTLYR